MVHTAAAAGWWVWQVKLYSPTSHRLVVNSFCFQVFSLNFFTSFVCTVRYMWRCVGSRRCGGSLAALQTTEAVVPVSNPASVTVCTVKSRDREGNLPLRQKKEKRKGKIHNTNDLLVARRQETWPRSQKLLALRTNIRLNLKMPCKENIHIDFLADGQYRTDWEIAGYYNAGPFNTRYCTGPLIIWKEKQTNLL